MLMLPLKSTVLERDLGRQVAGLFGAGEQGGWYDVSDMSTLFQDAAGATPVTAVEQPVGRILDKSGRGNHATQATTTKRPVLSRRVNAFSTTQAVFNGTFTVIPDAFGPGFDGIQTTRTFPTDEVYLQINPSNVRGGSTYTLKMYLKKGGQANSSQTCTFYTSAGNCNFTMLWASGAISYGSTSGGFTITNHSSVKLSADSYYVTVDFAVPNGVTSVTFARVYCWAGQQGVPSYIIGNPQFSLATDAHLPYQWVNTATDYDADPAKFPAYLRFDGVDDALQTGNIDFTSTDKMTVWAGVTKLSDAAAGMVMELSQNINTYPGSFYITAPEYIGGAEFRFKSRGSVNTTTLAAFGNAAPISRLVTAVADIAGDVMTITAGATVSSSVDQGAGNYGNYPLYIGARAGTSLYFNGRLYSLIVRGAQSSLSQIEAAEVYMKQKMRLP